MSDHECSFCKGTLIIEYKIGEVNDIPILFEGTCPCVEINKQKFIGLQYKQLATTMNHTIQEVCRPVGSLMSAARSIGDNAEKFFKSQMKAIGSI